jgi:hypothetical protein
MNRPAWATMGAALGLWAAACGYPTFTTVGGTGGATTTVGSSSSGSPAPCRLMHDATDCPSGYRCTIGDTSTGATTCSMIAAGALPRFSACATDADCGPGDFCDGYTQVCMAFCATNAQCNGGSCVSAHGSPTASIPSTSVCTANCDPENTNACGAGAACDYDGTEGVFDCFASLDVMAGDSCSAGNDCAPDLVCAGGNCAYWCHPADMSQGDCQGGLCMPFSNLMPMYNGTLYGFCE